MCNLYNVRRSRDELVKLFGITRVGKCVRMAAPQNNRSREDASRKQQGGQGYAEPCLSYTALPPKGIFVALWCGVSWHPLETTALWMLP
jgi:hypothetical protein